MKSLVLCCSKRFKNEAYSFVNKLEEKGVLAYKPPLLEWNEELLMLPKSQQRLIASGLTHDHFKRIREAETVFIFNKDGYIGNSVTLELAFAVALGKPVYALEPDNQELCRDILFTDICPTWQSLFKKLQ